MMQSSTEQMTTSRLDCLSLNGVERILGDIRLESSTTTLLSWLHSPTSSAKDVFKDVLHYLTAQVEANATQVALVWRYARLLRAWENHEKPELRTESAFLEDLDPRQNVRMVLQYSTLADAVCRGQIEIIQHQWGDEWHEEAVQRKILPSDELGPMHLSSLFLSNLAELCRVVDRATGMRLCEERIRERAHVMSRFAEGSKPTTVSYLMFQDIQDILVELFRSGVGGKYTAGQNLASQESTERADAQGAEPQGNRSADQYIGSSEGMSAQERPTHASADTLRRRCIENMALDTPHQIDVQDGADWTPKRRSPNREQRSSYESQECPENSGREVLRSKSARISSKLPASRDLLAPAERGIPIDTDDFTDGHERKMMNAAGREQSPTEAMNSTSTFRQHVMRRMEGAARRRKSLHGISKSTRRALDKSLSRWDDRAFVLIANRLMFRRHRQALKKDDTQSSLRLTPFLQHQELKFMSHDHQDDVSPEEEVDHEIERWVQDKDGSCLMDESCLCLHTHRSAQQVFFYLLDKDEKGLLIPREEYRRLS